MPSWTDYTKKQQPSDNDLMMIEDVDANVNKRLEFSGLADWIVEKLKKNNVISGALKFKGSSAYASLPTNPEVNDYYYSPDGNGTDGAGYYAWNGTAWIFIGNNDKGVDSTFTVEGAAADSKAVGDKFAKVDSETASLKEDLANQENRLEPIVKSNEDSKDAFYICDADGNIICKVDKDGVHSTGFDGKNLALNDVISTYEDSFYISDSNGNVIFKADKDGVRGLNMGVSSNISSPFKGMKLLTIGDSLSAHNNWQKWLVEWLGVTFDNDENINGKDGHKPMAKGGTAIAPTTEDSIYMRSLDAKYYADDTNGTVIIIYAGQNDSVTLGTIDDTPYTDKIVTASSNLTFYSSYMGMIENILADIPSARIYLMTQMPVRLEIGMTGTADPYIGVIRFPDMTSVLAYEANRYKKVEAIRAISKKYSLPCIDLWEDSGINDYNSKYWYGAVGGTCGQVHPNKIGYKRMAEVAVAKMY
nr:MAG TPA: hydrolase [Caudoviricetes sp.]